MLFVHGAFHKAPQGALTLSIFALLLSAALHVAYAADTVSSTYQQERATCLSGKSNQDRATCLKEAGAAKGEAKRGHLTDTPGSYEQNALTRCNALPAPDREDCARRVRGEGTTSGSVGAGGIYRETRTTVVGPRLQPMQSQPMQQQPMQQQPMQQQPMQQQPMQQEPMQTMPTPSPRY